MTKLALLLFVGLIVYDLVAVEAKHRPHKSVHESRISKKDDWKRVKDMFVASLRPDAMKALQKIEEVDKSELEKLSLPFQLAMLGIKSVLTGIVNYEYNPRKVLTEAQNLIKLKGGETMRSLIETVLAILNRTLALTYLWFYRIRDVLTTLIAILEELYASGSSDEPQDLQQAGRLVVRRLLNTA